MNFLHKDLSRLQSPGCMFSTIMYALYNELPNLDFRACMFSAMSFPNPDLHGRLIIRDKPDQFKYN
jgi:hypothetical protein